MDVSILGKNIKKFRTMQGITLSELKKTSGVGYSTLHDIESGKSQNLKSNNLEKVADALNVSTNELLGIEIETYIVEDLEGTIEEIFKSDELSLNDEKLSDNEKEELKDIFSIGIELIKRKRERRCKE